MNNGVYWQVELHCDGGYISSFIFVEEAPAQRCLEHYEKIGAWATLHRLGSEDHLWPE